MNALLQFFSSKWKKNYAEVESRNAEKKLLCAPGTNILYDPRLVAKLIRDHSQLVSVYTDIIKSLEKGLYSKINLQLDLFLVLFNDHALTEYTKLYVFLDYSLRPYAEEHALVMKFRKEMQEIGKVVRLFVHNWKNTEIDESNALVFSSELQKIGGVLSKRISVEEKQLYKIYEDAPDLLNATQLVAL